MPIHRTFAPCKKLFLGLAILTAFGITTPSFAQNSENTEETAQISASADLVPVKITSGDSEIPPESDSTHPPLRMTPDKSELIYLDKDAGSIIVGNPVHLSILADSSKTLVAIPRLPGATYFTVLDGKGEVLMQRHVIVASPKDNYIRIKRTCNTDVENCQSTSVFYCPDMCHPILMGGEEDSKSSSTTSASQDSERSSGGLTPDEPEATE